MGYQRVTPIDALPELEQIDSGRPSPGGAPGGMSGDKIKRFIRKTHQPQYDLNLPPVSPVQQAALPIRPSVTYNVRDTEVVMDKPQIISQPGSDCNCIQVLNHSKSCPICVKLYKSDNTVYLIIIAILSVISILLMKKVLDI